MYNVKCKNKKSNDAVIICLCNVNETSDKQELQEELLYSVIR